MPKLSNIEFARRGFSALLERAKERFPSTMVLPGNFSGAPDVDAEIVAQLNWLHRHGVEHPLNMLARLVEKDPRSEAGYDGNDKPWFNLIAGRIKELHTVALWYITVKTRGTDKVALPLFLTRLGCETAEHGAETCRAILRRSGLIANAK